MKIKALVNFSGAFSMVTGEERECSDEATLRDLLQAKYVEEVKEKSKPKKQEELKIDIKEPLKKGVKANVSK